MHARYTIRRLVLSIPIVVGVTLATFLLMTLCAGDYIPGLELAGNLRPEDLTRLRTSLGLDRPLYVQYLSWLGGVLQGNFGHSMIDGSSVSTQILQRLPYTLELTIAGMLLAVIMAIPLGVVGAINRGKKLDLALSSFSVVGFAVPQFWLGLMMILLFSVTFRSWGLPWLPSSGAYTVVGGGDLLDRLRHLLMPATVVSLVYLSTWSRFIRSSMLAQLSEDYVRTARAKGLSARVVLYRHALRNGLLPLVTWIGLELPRLVSGSLVVEVIFGWPGVGRLTFERATQYDYTSVVGITTFVGLMVVVGNLLADLAYSWLDPRIQRT